MLTKSISNFDSHFYQEIWICTKRDAGGVWLFGKPIGFCRREVADVLRNDERFRFSALSTKLTSQSKVEMSPFFEDRIEILEKAGV